MTKAQVNAFICIRWRVYLNNYNMYIFTRKFHIDAIGIIYIIEQKENDTYLYIVCTSSENLTTVAIYIYDLQI